MTDEEIDKLQKLQELKENGILSQEEFDKEKDKILNQQQTNYSKNVNAIQYNNSYNENASYSENKGDKYAKTARIITGIGLIINPFGILGILGLVYSIMALSNNAEKEKGWATTCLIISIIEIIFWFIVFVGIMSEDAGSSYYY